MRIKKLRQSRDRGALRRHLEVECQAVAEAGFRFLGERTLDVSERGLLLQSDAHVLIGEAVVVSFRAPSGTDWIDAEAVVARVVKGLRDTDRCPGIGLRFTRMDNIDRILLRERLRNIPPPTPARGLRRDYAGLVRNIDFLSPASLSAHGYSYLAAR